MANNYRAFRLANVAINASGAADAYFTALDRDSNTVLLPAYIQEAGVLDTQLSAKQMQLLSREVQKRRTCRQGACAAPDGVAQVERAGSNVCAT